MRCFNLLPQAQAALTLQTHLRGDFKGEPMGRSTPIVVKVKSTTFGGSYSVLAVSNKTGCKAQKEGSLVAQGNSNRSAGNFS